jgi:histone-lysine N-methyltransferase SETMAR
MSNGCIHLTLSWNDRMLNGMLKSPRKKIAQCSQGALKVLHIMFFSWNGHVCAHPTPPGTTVNGQYYCALLQDKLRLALHRKQLLLLMHGVISSRTMQHLFAIVMCKIWWTLGRGVLAHLPYSPDLAPCDYWLFLCVKEHFPCRQFA